MTSSLISHPISTTGATVLAERPPPFSGQPVRMSLIQGNHRWPLEPRAIEETARLTGLRKNRLVQLAEPGMDLRRILVGPSEQTLYLSLSQATNTVAAVSIRKPMPINVTEILELADTLGYRPDIPNMPNQPGVRREHQNASDAYLGLVRLDDKPFLIAGDRYRSGSKVGIDLAGHARPSVNLYLERQVCENGQMIQVGNQERLVPQYDNDGGVNAATLGRHLEAWNTIGLPDDVMSRLTIAANTAASYGEVLGLHQLIKSPEIVGLRRSQRFSQRSVSTLADEAIEQMLGDWRARTGVAALSEIPRRDLRFLPSETTVAGLINLATECATWYVNRSGGNTTFQRWWNRMIQRTYDLERAVPRTMALPARWITAPAQTAMMSTNPSAN